MVDFSNLIIPEPTNAERDAEARQFGRRDSSVRWLKYPDARVRIEGGEDFDGNGDYGFHVTLDDGRFMTGSGYNSAGAARIACERKLKQNAGWQTPAPRTRELKRSEAFGAIGQPSGGLADYLAKWTAENS